MICILEFTSFLETFYILHELFYIENLLIIKINSFYLKIPIDQKKKK